MNPKLLITLILTCIASSALGYNASHGPFFDDAEVETIKLTELSRESDVGSASSDQTISFNIPDQKALGLSITRTAGVWFAELVIEGNRVLQPTAFSNFDFPVGLTASSADLNQDGIPDIIIYSYSGGCGLACGYCNVAFILSSGDRYTLTTIRGID